MFNPSLALELAYIAVEEALRLKASYADARFEAVWQEEVAAVARRLEVADSSTERGLGVRVLHGGAWGFAAVVEPTRHDVGVAVRRAVELARAAAILQEDPVELSDHETQRGVYRTPIERDPMGVPLSDKAQLLLELDDVMLARGGVVHAQANFRSRRRRGVLVSSEGSEIEQDLVFTAVGFQAGASDGSNYRTRSYLGGDGLLQGRGWEAIETRALVDAAREVAEDAVALLSAEPCPDGSTNLILGGAQVAAHLLHGLGPLLELDRVVGLGPSGHLGTFLSAHDLGGRRLGSDHVNLVSDAQQAAGVGSYGYDDEGVPGDRFELIDEGRLAGYLSSRETAARVGLACSQGCMRASSWREPPRPRVTNLILEPGPNGDLEALVADTRRGVLMDGPKSFSIDPSGRTFVAGCESGWLIEEGRRSRRIVNPTYRGATEAFWLACDAVADASSWSQFGVLASAGPAAPALARGAGASPARFAGVEVGSRPPRLVDVPAEGQLPLARFAAPRAQRHPHRSPPAAVRAGGRAARRLGRARRDVR